MKDLLDIKEAAEILNYNECYLRQLIRAKKIPAGRFGGSYVLFRSILEDYEKPCPGRKPRLKRPYKKHNDKYWDKE